MWCFWANVCEKGDKISDSLSNLAIEELSVSQQDVVSFM
jgi:hypothetical protein